MRDDPFNKNTILVHKPTTKLCVTWDYWLNGTGEKRYTEHRHEIAKVVYGVWVDMNKFDDAWDESARNFRMHAATT